MLSEDWPKYWRTRQPTKQPKSKCMKRWCWAYCVTTRKHEHLLQKQTDSSEFLKWMLEADHGRHGHAKRPYQKRGHQSQPWHYRGYTRKNQGKKTTIFYDISVMWSEWTNTVCQTLHYMVEWKWRESKEDPGSTGWIMLLTTAIIEAGAS